MLGGIGNRLKALKLKNLETDRKIRTGYRDEEVAEKIVEVLEDMGSANLTELCRTIGCGKSTIYRAVKILETKGIIETRLIRGRRIAILKERTPAYLKVLAALTALTSFLCYLDFRSASALTVNMNMNSNPGVVQPSTAPAFIIILSILAGYWIAVLMLKPNDVAEACSNLKKFLEESLFRIESVLGLKGRKT